MARHCENTLAVARFLARHPKVAWVRYPGLEADPAHALARKYLQGGFGGMAVFGVKPGAAGGAKEAGQRCIEALRLFSLVANVGDAKSLALHPGSTTHSQLSDSQQREAGLTPEMIRLSIGLEHIDDILEDLDQALGKV
jgi:O-acetylhomoserine (thiol)-lyase